MSKLDEIRARCEAAVMDVDGLARRLADVPALLAVVDALPKCDEPECNNTAIMRTDSRLLCEGHALPSDARLPYADALRALERTTT